MLFQLVLEGFSELIHSTIQIGKNNWNSKNYRKSYKIKCLETKQGRKKINNNRGIENYSPGGAGRSLFVTAGLLRSDREQALRRELLLSIL